MLRNREKKRNMKEFFLPAARRDDNSNGAGLGYLLDAVNAK